ncbi:hypothetical protein T484DRAFT_1826534 [Baffinella frigidus]|nr:hypothetical protein T484DRAFT_1826534 [Cryptophyta sp. CCMP2293]
MQRGGALWWRRRAPAEARSRGGGQPVGLVLRAVAAGGEAVARGALLEVVSLVAALEARALALVGEFQEHDIAMMVRSTARLGLVAGDPLLQALEARAVTLAPEFAFRNALMLLLALQKMEKVAGEALVVALTRRCTAILQGRCTVSSGSVEAQEVANLAWVLAKMRVVARALVVVDDFTAQKRANEVWPLSRSPLAMGNNAQEMANMVWALSCVEKTLLLQVAEETGEGGRHLAPDSNGTDSGGWARRSQEPAPYIPGLEPELLDAFSERALVVAEDFEPQHVAMLLWGLGKMDLFANEQLLQVLQERALATMPEWEAREVAMLAWALAHLQVGPEAGLVEALETRAVAVAGDLFPVTGSSGSWHS